MKINQRINKQVNNSVAECRNTIVKATIELLKKIQKEPGQEIAYGIAASLSPPLSAPRPLGDSAASACDAYGIQKLPNLASITANHEPIIFHLQREMKNEMLTKEKDLAELGNLSDYVSINTTLSTR